MTWKTKWKRASELQQYEKAKEIRDTLHRLNNLRINQKMEKAVNRNAEEEYVGILERYCKRYCICNDFAQNSWSYK